MHTIQDVLLIIQTIITLQVEKKFSQIKMTSEQLTNSSGQTIQGCEHVKRHCCLYFLHSSIQKHSEFRVTDIRISCNSCKYWK